MGLIPSISQADVRESIHQKTPAINLTGEITPLAAHQFRTIADRGYARVVILTSEGGGVDSAMEIGRIIRLRNMDTVATDKCASACVYLFMAGRKRTIDGSGMLLAHTPTLNTERYKTPTAAFEVGLKLAVDLKDYVTEMGYDASLLNILISDRRDHWPITKNEADRLGLVTNRSNQPITFRYSRK